MFTPMPYPRTDTIGATISATCQTLIFGSAPDHRIHERIANRIPTSLAIVFATFAAEVTVFDVLSSALYHAPPQST